MAFIDQQEEDPSHMLLIRMCLGMVLPAIIDG